MPLIKKMIEFSAEDNALISEKLSTNVFSHSHWSSDELLPIRSKIRRFYRDEQAGICAYCKSDVSLVSASNAHVEHIAPKSIHLKFIFEPMNLCVICADCNEIKRDQEVLNNIPDTFSRTVSRYPRSSGAFKIVHPHLDDYDEHILIKGRIYIDKSSKGIFTIGACKLNRFFHKFNVDDEFINDQDLINEMTRFMDGESSIQKAQALNRIRNMLLNI